MRPSRLLAILTIGVAGCFGSPQPAHPPNPLRDRLRETLHRELAGHLPTIPGDSALYFKDLDTEEVLAFQADRPFRADGVIALFILVEAHQRAYEGTLDLDTEADLAATEPGAVAGDAKALQRAVGSRPTTRRLCEEMVVAGNDCAANNLLFRLGGPASVAQSARARGASRTALPLYLTDESTRQAGPRHETTATDIGRLLERIARRQVVSPESASEIARMLTCSQGGFLARLLPPDETEIAHKPGAGKGVRHDAGIVTCANGTYVLALLMQGLTDEQAGETAGAAISRRVYDYILNRPR